MTADRQFWHYTKARCLDEVPYERGVMLALWNYENLVLPGVDGVRDVYVVFENGPTGAQKTQWFPCTDLDKASHEFRRREKAAAGVAPASFPLKDIEEKWAEDETIADCRSKGKDIKIGQAGGLFYVDCDGERTQVRLDERAVVRYLANALEDGS